MAIIKCPECGKEISDNAESCPNCGYPIKPKSIFSRKIYIPIGITMILSAIVISIIIVNKLSPEEQVQVNSVITSINAIGDVSIQSDKAIKDADAEYNNLSDKCKRHVDNYSKLTEAKNTYDMLRADVVIKIIDDIDENADADQIISKINNAELTYKALSEEQKNLVTNYDTFLNIKTNFSDKRIKEVESTIEAIGVINLDSNKRIKKARTLFDKLTSDEKSNVNNTDILINAESNYEIIAIDNCEKLINLIGEVSLDSNAKITEASIAYSDLSDEQKKKVTNYKTLEVAESRYKELREEEDIKNKTISPGDSFRNTQWEITFKNAHITDRILPNNTNSFYTYYTARDDSVFLDIVFNIKNVDTGILGIENLVRNNCKVDYKGSSINKSCELFVSTGTSINKVYSWDGLDALDSCTLHVVITMPRELNTNEEAVRAYVTLSGMEKIINIRGYDKDN